MCKATCVCLCPLESTLNVEEIPFEMLNGNCQGYAKGRQIAINPLAQMPVKTTLHELAHIELGHTSEAIHDSETTPRSLREVEAESVALLCLESLGIDGAERVLLFRGYLYPDDRNASAWFTPGGGVDDGESLAAAASRELREEYPAQDRRWEATGPGRQSVASSGAGAVRRPEQAPSSSLPGLTWQSIILN